SNVIAFLRQGSGTEGSPRVLLCAANLSPVPRPQYPGGLPTGGTGRKALDTDSRAYGGSDAFAGQPTIEAAGTSWQEQPTSGAIDIPAPTGVWVWRDGPAA